MSSGLTQMTGEDTSGSQLVSLYYLKAELSRRRLTWIAAAVIGVVLGAGLHFVVPWTYQASTLVVLTHDPSQDPALAMSTDVVLARTEPVAAGAIRTLHLDVTPSSFLKKYTAASQSTSLLSITAKGSSPAAAVQSANAITASFLRFRAAQLTQQNGAIVAALDRQVAALTAKIKALDTEIDRGSGANNSGPGASNNLTDAVGVRAQASNQQEQLQATIQADTLATNSIVEGSHLINAAIPSHQSRVKRLIVNGATGLIAGLGLGIFVVILSALLSDRLRRRDDIAAALGTPVAISIRPTRWWRPATSRRRLTPAVSYVVRSLLDQRTGSCVVVAIDSTKTTARIVLGAASEFVERGQPVTLVDLTSGGELTRIFDREGQSGRPAASASSRHRHGDRIAADITNSVGTAAAINLIRPADADAALNAPFGVAGQRLTDRSAAGPGRPLDIVIALADVDLSGGTGDFATLVPNAMVVTSAGRASGTKLHSVARVLRHGGLTLVGAIMLNADAQDESTGLPDPAVADVTFDRPIGMVNS